MNRGMFMTVGSPLTTAGIIKAAVPSIANHLGGLELSTAGSSATFSVNAGAATDSTNADFMKLTAATSKTTSAWTPGTGGGSLDTGVIATSTWYHAFLIKRPDTVAVDVLTSLSPTAPTMPAPYTLFRRIGAMKTNGSSQWTTFTQTGDTFIWATSVADVSAIAPTATRVNKVLTVPTGIVVTALFRADLNFLTTQLSLLFTSLQETDQAPVAAGFADLTGVVASGGGSTAGTFERLVDTSAQIGVRATGTSGNYSIFTYGWKDTRGK